MFGYGLFSYNVCTIQTLAKVRTRANHRQIAIVFIETWGGICLNSALPPFSHSISAAVTMILVEIWQQKMARPTGLEPVTLTLEV